MTSHFSQGFAIFLMIVIGLALTPTVVENIVIAQNGHMWDGEALNINPAVSNVTTLSHASIWNNSAYITVILNSSTYTYGTNYTVSSLSPSQLTFVGLGNTAVYNGTVDYRTPLSGAEYVLVGLTSLFWVLLLIGGIAIAVVKLFKFKDSKRG